jgi:hypothetical protein
MQPLPCVLGKPVEDRKHDGGLCAENAGLKGQGQWRPCVSWAVTSGPKMSQEAVCAQLGAMDMCRGHLGTTGHSRRPQGWK